MYCPLEVYSNRPSIPFRPFHWKMCEYVPDAVLLLPSGQENQPTIHGLSRVTRIGLEAEPSPQDAICSF